jgi:hypothetical protein
LSFDTSALLSHGNKQITVISRIRRDAKLFMLQPKRTGKRGRPRQRGKRIGTPTAIAEKVKRWKRVATEERGRSRERLVFCQQVLWYAVSKMPVLLVISRDPEGVEHDDFWVCSNVDMPPAAVVSAYAGRWSIEDTFRATKQTLGAHHPQSWAGNAPERSATLGFLLYSLIWWWYLGLEPSQHAVSGPAWYPEKCKPSFNDAIAAIRRVLWKSRISIASTRRGISNQITETLLDVLCRAA